MIFHLPIVSTIRYLPIFMVGTIISVFELLLKKQTKKMINPFFMDVFGCIVFLIILLTTPYYFEHIFGFKVNFHSSKLYFPYAVLWGILLISAKYGQGFIKFFLELKFLRFIGTISYSLYLFHMLFLNLTKQLEVNTQMKFFIFFISSILFSSFSYLLIERPLSKIKLYSTNLDERRLYKQMPENKN